MKIKLLYILLCCFFYLISIEAQTNNFRNFAGKPYSSYHFALRDSLRKRYDSGDPEYVRETVNQLKQLPDLLKDNQWQLEAGFLDANYQHDYLNGDRETFVAQLNRLLSQSRKMNNKVFEIRIMRRLFDLDIHANNEMAMQYARQMDKLLEKITSSEYPDKADCMYRLSELYLTNNDYERAEKNCLYIASLPVEINNTRPYVHARNNLGIIQRRFYNDPDSSDYWFYSILALDSVYNQEITTKALRAIVYGNLGQNELHRDQYNQAALLMKRSFDIMYYEERDYSYAYGMAAGLANCYVALKQYKEAYHYINLAEHCARYSNRTMQRRQALYQAKSNYYAAIGEPALAAAYMDSVIRAGEKSFQQNNMNQFLQAEQQLNAEELEMQKRESRKLYQRFMLFLILAIVLCLLLLIYVILFFRKRKAYRLLADKSHAWAIDNQPYQEVFPDLSKPEIEANNKSVVQTDELTDSAFETEKLLKHLRDYIEESHCYTNASLTLDDLSRQMSVNRTYLSQAINSVDKNFNLFINKYRIREAIRIMTSDKKSLNLEDISILAGFNNRRSFYNAFKAITGLSPQQFKQNREKTEAD